MVIGFFASARKQAALVLLAPMLLMLPTLADDQITKTDGTTISGQIVGSSDGQVMVQTRTSTGTIAKFPVTISDIKSISMAVPPAVTAAEAEGVAAPSVIAALESPVKNFAGMPTGWVVDAMARLAEAYSAQGQTDKASAIYNQILQLYPRSNYSAVAKAGQAAMELKAGKVDEALTAVQPIVEQANKNIAPSPSEGELYGNAFIVYGQALQAQKNLQAALEAYLTVKTMFYQNPGLAAKADELAKNLRDQNPGLGVP